jgi:hypothetical protein
MTKTRPAQQLGSVFSLTARRAVGSEVPALRFRPNIFRYLRPSGRGLLLDIQG